MKKRVLSMFMALALCLTLLPAPVRAAEDTPESGAIVQEEQEKAPAAESPAILEQAAENGITVQDGEDSTVSEQAGTNEDENGAEGGRQNTGTPDAGGTEDSKADAPENGEDENAGNNADAAVSAVQTMIDALPAVSELDGMTAGELDAAYNDIQAAYDAYEALNAEQQAQITGADFETLFGWFNSQTALLADEQSGVHTHCVCGKDHQEIGNHKSADEKTFTAWKETTSLPTSGAYYLTQDVTISGNVTLTEDVTLCLNGHTVTVSGININGNGTLTLTDCADQQGTIQGSSGDTTGVLILGSKDSSNASFVMYGGKITGFKNAVIAKEYSSFTMYGGSITGNKASSGAAVSGRTTGTTLSDNKSIITMYGGEISNNTGETGGGVYVGQNCTFTLAGGKISGNTASGHKNQNPTISGQYAMDGGGGVYLDSFGKFNMTGGEISGNTATGNGGGVCVMTYAAGYSVSITGGKITGNTASDGTACGGGFYGGPAKLTIQNTEISGNKCAGSGGGIFANQPLTLEGVQITNNTANTANQGSEGGGVKLGGDDKNFKDYDALTVSGKTSISDNSPNNYYVDRSCLLPIKVSGALDENARIGICMNPAYDTDSKFLPTDGKDSVVATAEGMTLSAANFFPDSYNSDYVVRTDTSGGVKFGLCDHEVPEGSNECRKCHTTFVAVLEPTDASAKKGYFRDLSNGAKFDNMTGKLKLLQDVTLSGSIITMRGGTPTLDLNGHTINGGAHFNLDGNAVLTVIDSSADTTNRTLNVNFYVNPGCTLNLYDGKNEQGFRGTVAFVDLKSTGKLVSCGGKIEQLDLRPSNDYNVRLWQSNTQYCTVGIIRVASLETTTVSDFLKKNHPGAMLYGTKSGSTAAERISGNTTINKDGVDGGSYTNLYLQTCETHEPTSESNLKCKHCGAELVVKISAVKDGTEQVGYFAEASKDKGTWPSGYAEAAAQLADWVNKDGCTDAKLFPLNDNAYSIPVTCKMTLVGTGHKYINVTVKDGADVLLEGGEYENITVNGGEATIPDVKCEKVTVNGGKATFRNVECGSVSGVKVNGGEAIFESGTYKETFVMKGGTVTVKDGVTFTYDYQLAFQVEKGTLNVEGGTITGGVSIENPVNLTISGGTFKQAVTITRYDDSTTGTCSISGGTFEDKLTLYRSAHNLSALLAEGCAYYQNGTIANGEVKELSNVTVKSDGHTHSFDATTGQCRECGKQMAASVTVGDGSPTYYVTIGAAVTALNAADGAKTLKLFQDINNSSEIYTLTNGPVTLDLNGKEFWGEPFIAQGITLTLKSEKAGGSVFAVRAVGKDSKIIANSTNIENDGNLTVREISAEKGGRLELSAGTFLDLYVVNDGSSASLSGGTYQPQSYNYGKGPDKNTEYAGAYDLLANGCGYQKKQTDGSFAWVTSGLGISSTFRDTYKVVEIGASFEKIYPDDKTDFTGDTYLVKLGEDQTTYTLKLTAVGTPTDRVSYQWQSGSSDGVWTNRPQAGDSNYEVDATKGTITIKNLNPGTYRYKVKYTLKDTTGAEALTGYSAPLTVVVTKHEHSWAYSAEGATITAKCTAEGCYLTDKLGGTFTISAPAANTLTYDGSTKEATAKLDAVSGVTSLPTAGDITYTQNGKTLPSAPVTAGEYTASITVGNATASVEYTIAKANPVVTEWPTISASVYVNSEATLTGGSGVGTFAFKAGAAKSWNSAGNKTTTVVFTPTDTNNYKELTRDYTVTVVKRTVKSCTTPTGITDKPCGTAQEELGLPGTVTITTEDGKTFNNIPVTWGGYDPNTLEEQTLTGTLDLTSIADEVEQPGAPVTAQIKVKLTPKSFSGISAAAYEGVYDGNAHGITLTGVPSGAIVKYGESADSCTQDSLTYTDFTDGAKTVYYKVSQPGYTDASGSATVNITKRPLTVSNITENKTYAYASGSDDKAIGVDIARKLPPDRGTTIYTVAKKDPEQLLSEVTVDTAGNLTYKVNQVDSSKVGKTAIITVTASMENYENVEYTLTINITDKKTVEIKRGNTVSVDGSNALTYGEKVSKLTLGNTVFVEAGTDDMLEGILSWSNPDEIPAAGTTQAGWVFKPADSTHYAELTGTAAITVAKATPIVVTVPTVAERGYNPDAALTSSDITGGSVTGADGNSLAGTWSFTGTNIIPTVNNKGYQAVFTPDDTNNYNTVTRTITVTVNKAAKAPNMPEAAMTPAHSTKKVGNITLQEGWSWQEADKDTVLADGVAVTATAVYIGADKGNYETESVSITITRRECDHTHTEIRNQREATCTQTGYAGDTYCTDCDKLLSTGKELAALGHDYKVTVTKQPTTTEEGVRTYTCTRCNSSYTESIAKLPEEQHTHNYTGSITKEATCTEAGVRTYTCSCGDSYTENIPATGHSYVSKVTKAATTTEEGIMTYTCSKCGHSYTQPIAKIKSDDSSKDNGSQNQKPQSGTGNDNQNQKPQPDTDKGKEKGDSIKPYIKDDSGKKGWDVIKPQLEEAKSGDTVTVAMNGTTVVPKDVIDSIKGKDTTLVLDMGNGLSWKIYGKDITDAAGDIDFDVTVGADAGKSIPVDVINNVTGERSSLNLTLAYDGEFGFIATLTVNMESKNAGLYANLFYYNEQTGELEFISAGQIDPEGNVELVFTHASDYTIVVDAKIMSDNGQTDNKSDETIPAPKTDDSTSKYAWNNTIIIIIGICIILIVFGAVFYVRKKSGSEEE